MPTRFTVLGNGALALAALGALQVLSVTTILAADCSAGSAEEKVACLDKKVADLEAKIATLKEETLKWNDRISLVNEDMRIFPRCLDNPAGAPDTPFSQALALKPNSPG
jgi:hypothetical protein